jgi:ankyrin repeat protein
MLELLFRYSCVPVDVNVQNIYQSTALISAVHTRSIDLVRFLLEKDPDDLLKDHVKTLLFILKM